MKNKFKVFLSVVLSVLIFASVILSAGTPALASSVYYSFTDIKENIKPLSRVAKTEDGYEAHFAGGGVCFALDCSGDVSVSIDYKGVVGLISVVINDDIDSAKSIRIEKEGVQDIVIAEDLGQGTYTFEILKGNSQDLNEIIFKGVSFTGTLCDRPADKSLKLEFYGDSISAGVGSMVKSVEAVGVPVGYQNNYIYSYNYYCAKYLNADINSCALPGYGYVCGYSTGRQQNLYPHMSKALFSKDVAYDHSDFIADIVIIELGTNDVNYIKQHEEIVEDDEIDKAVQDYIDKIRSYNKDCVIVLIGSPGTGSFMVKDKINKHYIKLDNALLRAAATNEKTYLFSELSMGTSGGAYHPHATEAAVGGKNLADYITDTILSGKEPPKTVAKEEFYLNFDVNSDDKLNVLDALAMRHYLCKSKSNVTKKDADVNFDGVADVKDSLKIVRKLAELE